MAATNVAISIRIVDRVSGPLKRFDEQKRTLLRQGMEEIGHATERKLRVYPPPLRYIRTGRLRSSWSTRTTGTAERPVVTVRSSGNIAPYNRVVQSRAAQHPIHRGRWLTAEDVTERDVKRDVEGLLTRISQAASDL